MSTRSKMESEVHVWKGELTECKPDYGAPRLRVTAGTHDRLTVTLEFEGKSVRVFPKDLKAVLEMAMVVMAGSP